MEGAMRGPKFGDPRGNGRCGGADTAENGHDKEQRVNVSEARGGRLGRARKTWEGRAEVRETDKSQSKDRRKEERPGGGEGGCGAIGGQLGWFSGGNGDRCGWVGRVGGAGEIGKEREGAEIGIEN